MRESGFYSSTMRKPIALQGAILLWLWLATSLTAAAAEPGATASYWVCVTNEKSGDMTVIDGASGKVLQTVPVGKRPRGIHPSPDGSTIYVALSGSPITGPPQLDAKGNPIQKDDDDDDKNADRSADGIGVV